MKFMMTFCWKEEPQAQSKAIARFKKTGAQPPKGVKLLGRWMRADFGGGFDLLETDDSKRLTEFALMWSDLLCLRVVPVVDDEELVQVLKRAGK